MARKMIDMATLTPLEKEEFRNRYDAYFFDMDGCLTQLEGGVIKGAAEAIEVIKKNGKSVSVITDNCLSTLENISTKIHKLFPTIEKENVFNTTYFLGKYLKDIGFNKKIYVIGVDGIVSDLKKFGYEVVYDAGAINLEWFDIISLVEGREKGVGAVVVAADYNYTYLKMAKAVNYLTSDPEVLFFQTDYLLSALEKPRLPGGESLTLPIKAASGRNEAICTGKGGECSIKYIKSLKYKMERCLFVGDGLTNDVLYGNLSGMDTLLVLSGVSTLKDVEDAKNENKETLIPTYYTNSVADLFHLFKQ